MSLFTQRHKTAIFFIVILGVICSPIWGVKYFVNQDGSGHLYTSYVMLELLRGNTFFANVFVLNSLAVPNSSGHWLMAGLLTFLSPILVTKVILTLTIALFATAIVWLRARTAGDEDLYLTILFAFAVGSNWLWLQGSYNYILAAAASTFTLGVFYKWREDMTFSRIAIIALLLIFVFISHLICFALLAGSLLVLAIFTSNQVRRRALFAIVLAILTTVPLLLSYRSLSRSGGEPFVPAWRSLSSTFSPLSFAKQIVWADPFVFISRKTLPFYSGISNRFVVFSPVLWIMLSVALILIASVIAVKKDRSWLRPRISFFVLFVLAVFGALTGPDDFGLQNGSLLRERVLIAALIFVVPIFRVRESRSLRLGAALCLTFVICFQTTAFWDYSLTADAESREFMTAREAIPENSSIASIVLVENGLRFHSTPTAQLNNYLGINKNVIVWDDYELGHYMFPVAMAKTEDQNFVFEFTTSNVFYLNNTLENFDERLSKLSTSLAVGHDRIKYLVVYGADPRLVGVLEKWFEPEPIYARGKIQVFQNRRD